MTGVRAEGPRRRLLGRLCILGYQHVIRLPSFLDNLSAQHSASTRESMAFNPATLVDTLVRLDSLVARVLATSHIQRVSHFKMNNDYKQLFSNATKFT